MGEESEGVFCCLLLVVLVVLVILVVLVVLVVLVLVTLMWPSSTTSGRCSATR